MSSLDAEACAKVFELYNTHIRLAVTRTQIMREKMMKSKEYQSVAQLRLKAPGVMPVAPDS